MARKKLLRLQEIDIFQNIFRMEQKDVEKKLSNFFQNENPITLEIGCGHGDYSINLAKKYPSLNFIALDMKVSRLWVGAKKALTENIPNIVFLIGKAQNLSEVFTKIRPWEIWVPFPDSLPRRRDNFKRLYSSSFIDIYKKILFPKGIIHFKTDDFSLYEFAIKNLNRPDIKIIKHTENLYSCSEVSFAEKTKTTYEKVHLQNGRTIKYIEFQFIMYNE